MSYVNCINCRHTFFLESPYQLCPNCEHSSCAAPIGKIQKAWVVTEEEIEKFIKGDPDAKVFEVPLNDKPIVTDAPLVFTALVGKRNSVEEIMLQREQEREARSKQNWFAHKSKDQRDEKKSLDEKRAEVKEMMQPQKKTYFTVNSFLKENFDKLEAVFMKHNAILPTEKNALVNKYKKIKFVRLKHVDDVWEEIERRFRAEYFKLLKEL